MAQQRLTANTKKVQLDQINKKEIFYSRLLLSVLSGTRSSLFCESEYITANAFSPRLELL